VNQPVAFPFKGELVGRVTLEMGPEPTEQNPVTPGRAWGSSGPKFGDKRAPDWREIDVTGYVQKALAEGKKEISLCLAAATHSRNDDSRVVIFNEKHMKDEKDRGDMRPRLVVETE